MGAPLIINVEKILEVRTHPNADRLDIATVKGWNCVVGRDSLRPGDLVVYKDPFGKIDWNALVSGPSILCNKQKVREGLVIKSVNETNDYMGRKVFKFINPDYLLKKNNSDWH